MKISNETEVTYSDVFTNLPNTILGYRANGTPIYTIAGGAIDATVGGDEGDDDVASSVDTEVDDETPDADAWTPPSREDYEKLLEGKKKADSEAAARKRFLRDNGFDPKTGERVVKPSLEFDDDATAVTSEVTDTTSKFDKEKFEAQFNRQLERETLKAAQTARAQTYALIYEVPAALEDAGFNGKNPKRVLKLLDLNAVEIDDDGIDTEALNAQIAGLKEDFPEFFKRTRMKDAAKDVADAGTVGGGKKQAPASEEDLDWREKMKRQLYGPQA